MRHTCHAIVLLTVLISLVCLGPFCHVAQAANPAWRCDGPYGASIRSLAASPDYAHDHTILAGADRGLYRSIDGGQAWQPIAGIVEDITIASIGFSPAFSTEPIIYAASNQGGVLKSLDGGETWSLWSDGLTSLVAYQVAVSPSFGSDQTVFCATDRGLHKTTSSGKRWAQVGPVVPALSVAVGPPLGNDLTVMGGTSMGLYRSLDGGETWQETTLFGMPITSLAVSPDLNVVLAGTLSGLYVSMDVGETWDGPWFEDQVIHSVHCGANLGPDETLVAGSASGVIVSTDRGASWQTVDEVEDAVHAVTTSADDADLAVWAGTSHIGVLYAESMAGPWDERQHGITGRVIHAVEASPAYDRDAIAFAGGPVGLWRTVDDAQTWHRAAIADVGINALRCSPGFSSDRTAYAATNGGVFVSHDRGIQWHATGGVLPSLNVSDLVISSAGDIWAATSEGGIFYSDDAGASWVPRSDGLGTLSVTSLALAESDQDQRIIAGTWGQGVYYTANGGAQWIPSSTGPDSPHIRALDTAVGFDGRIWSFCGSTAAIYRSGNRAETWDLSSELGLDIAGIALHPDYAARTNAYAGAHTSGVLQSTNGGLSWQPLNNGLGNLDVNAIAVGLDDTSQAVVLAGTEGGVWRFGGEQRTPPQPEDSTLCLPLIRKTGTQTDSMVEKSQQLYQGPQRSDR